MKDSDMPSPLRDALLDATGEERGRMERIWDLLGRYEPERESDPSVDEAWADLNTRLASSISRKRFAAGAPDRSSRRRRAVRAGVVAAAAFTILFGTWFLLYPVTISVEPGAQSELMLPDGSTVEINSATELQYARYLALARISPVDRRVRLDGEAYFEVVPAGAAFVVETWDARVEVLGTAFNVRSRPGTRDGGTQVVLASGRVRVAAAANPDRPVILSEPGASGTVLEAGGIRASFVEQAVPLEHVLAWRHRGFAAVDRPLDAILDEVERRFGVTIAPREGIDPAEPMSLFYLRGGTVDQILRDVCLVQECTFRETSRGFELSPQDRSLQDRSPQDLSL